MTEIHYNDAKHCISWAWPDFHPKELACKCCGNLLVTQKSVDAWDKIQKFRNIVRVPVIINSAYRCKDYNRKVGGVKNSYHLKGRAFDVPITESLPRGLIHTAAREAGFTGFGDYKDFVHIDTGRARNWTG